MHPQALSQMISPLDDAQLREILVAVFPSRSVSNIQLLSGGLINTNLKIDFADDKESVVIRFYRDGADVCRKELALHDLIASRVRVPRVLHANPNGIDGSPTFVVSEYINGITFQALKQTNNLEAISQAAHSVGQTLASIGQFQFQKPGRLITDANRLEVGEPFIEGADPIPRLLDTFLESTKCQHRLGVKLVDQVHNFGWSWAGGLPNLNDECSLVHNDFGNRNILVCKENGRWVVAAIIDWEFAFSGSPLLDVGHFLRYESTGRPACEPQFSLGFVGHGGKLPGNWREIVRVIDLTGLVECLTHDELPVHVEAELLELTRATIEQREFVLN
jgi:hypothetical protein